MLTAPEEIESLTVAELVLAAQGGERQAEDALYLRYCQSSLALAHRLLGRWEEAEELVQDVFIHAFDRLGQLQIPEAFGGWLRQIVTRMAFNQLARRRATVSIEGEAMDATYSADETPLDEVLRTERCRYVREGLERLGEIDRQTLEAFYLGGQSLNEMAERFDAPLGTIKRRLHTARKRLAAEIGDFQAI